MDNLTNHLGVLWVQVPTLWRQRACPLGSKWKGSPKPSKTGSEDTWFSGNYHFLPTVQPPNIPKQTPKKPSEAIPDGWEAGASRSLSSKQLSKRSQHLLLQSCPEAAQGAFKRRGSHGDCAAPRPRKPSSSKAMARFVGAVQLATAFLLAGDSCRQLKA